VPTPGQPGAPSYSAIGDSFMALNWTSASDAASYDLYRCAGLGCTPTLYATGILGTSFNDTGLAQNTSYSYFVVAKNVSGSGSPSTTSSQSTLADTATPSPTVSATASATATPSPLATATPYPFNFTEHGKSLVYPAPAKGRTATMAYDMEKSGSIEVVIWNSNGDLVGTFNDQQPAGTQLLTLPIDRFAEGVYLYRLNFQYDDGTSLRTEVRRFVVVK
jgi:hypothetical protein